MNIVTSGSSVLNPRQWCRSAWSMSLSGTPCLRALASMHAGVGRLRIQYCHLLQRSIIPSVDPLSPLGIYPSRTLHSPGQERPWTPALLWGRHPQPDQRSPIGTWGNSRPAAMRVCGRWSPRDSLSRPVNPPGAHGTTARRRARSHMLDNGWGHGNEQSGGIRRAIGSLGHDRAHGTAPATTRPPSSARSTRRCGADSAARPCAAICWRPSW